MGVWAEPFTTLACRRSSILQDPFERADITSNTFWDWQMNHVGQIYGMMDDVFAFERHSRSFRRARCRRASTRPTSWKA